MQKIIQQKLRELEAESGYHLLIALESGSRAWGFPSPDSDYDVRFVFARNPDAYLSVNDLDETIDLPINDLLDINGWDIRKTLRLAGRSNATPLEWLQSPIVYREMEGMHDALWQTITPHFCARSTAAHYLGLTRGSVGRLKEQGDQQKLKTWFYVLRPLFAAEWILEKQSIPPMEFAPLREMTKDASLAEIIDELMEIKKDASESYTLPGRPSLMLRIEQRLTDARTKLDDLPLAERDPAKLDDAFREILRCIR